MTNRIEHAVTIETVCGRRIRGKMKIRARWSCACGENSKWLVEINHATETSDGASRHLAEARGAT